jgi:2-methylisocitrate lyase-like PEP mutase family enzyme
VDIATGANGFVMAAADSAARARLFRLLHQGPGVLVLPTVWDTGSAALVGGIPGVRALGTTSAGIAAAHGLPDGEQLPLDVLLAAVVRITSVAGVPVTVDLESGYGRSPVDVADSVASLIEVGAVGVTLEDGLTTAPDRLRPIGAHEKRIAAARTAGRQMGVPIVVNGRTDVYLRGIGAEHERLDEAVERLRRYHEAGADCLFLPGFPPPGLDRDGQRLLIADLARRLDGVPLNLLAAPDGLAVADLGALGVRRLSFGSALYRLGMAAVLESTACLLTTGRQDALDGANALSYGQLASAMREAGRR